MSFCEVVWSARMVKNILKLFLLMVLAFSFHACTTVYTARGAYYRVQKGDTLEGISTRFKKDFQELAEINNIEKVEDLKPGKSIYIPGVTPNHFSHIIQKVRVSKPYRAKKIQEKEGFYKKEKKEASIAPVPKIEVDHSRFIWPIRGQLSSLYGMRRGRRHDGIDIRAKTGTPVMAADQGEVVFSKRMRGYGNLILIKHDEDFFTVYAHNSVNLAKKGKKVKTGEMIAKTGRTGRATGPHLHFEVREGTKARNPLFFLPKNQNATKVQEKGEDNDTDDGRDEEENS